MTRLLQAGTVSSRLLCCPVFGTEDFFMGIGELFLLAVGLVILATYLLFICGSVALCKLLQKNKRY